MRKIWYQFVKIYVTIGLFFYYKRLKVYGRENIPKKGAILFVCNHPNALIDPLLIKTTITKDLFVLTRAGVFANNFLIKLFDSVKMIPIYRKRDGFNTISKNDAVFNRCYDILHDRKCILIFPEGSHSLLRKVRPLTKGFARIIFGTLQKYPDTEIQVVPIGLNYDSPAKYPSSVSIYYGKPVLANQYFNSEDVLDSINNLKDRVQSEMSKLTTHIEGDDEVYAKTLNGLDSLNVNYLNPDETNNTIKNLDLSTFNTKKKTSKNNKNLLYYLVVLNSIVPWLIWNKAKTKIKEQEFVSTFRFGLGISIYPVFYVIQSLIVSAIFGKTIGFYYFLACILSGLLLSKLSETNK